MFRRCFLILPAIVLLSSCSFSSPNINTQNNIEPEVEDKLEVTETNMIEDEIEISEEKGEEIIETEEIKQKTEQAFLSGKLNTNTAIRSIELDKVLGGGPSKDGIPSIDAPKFSSIENASKNLKDDTQGILINKNNKQRFYPYNILVWHEIVNDTFQDENIAVTFCPLCGSAVVYKAEVNNEAVQFGVSGKLYESNLLMYDRKTESLWSQIQGEAVVGEFTGKKLEVLPFQVLTFQEIKEKYPQSEILSDNTGFRKDYSFYPYGNYDSSETLYFPVSYKDETLSAKEIMYIVNVQDTSAAFVLKKLREEKKAQLEVNQENIEVIFKDGEVFAKNLTQNKDIPGYYGMWFSWVAHNKEDAIFWNGEK